MHTILSAYRSIKHKLHWEKPIIWMVQYLLRSYRPLQILIMMEMLSYSVEWGAVLPLALTPRLLKATHEKNIHIQQKKACTWRTCISELMATRRILDYFSISPLQATAAAVVWMHCTLYDMDTVSYHGMGAAIDFLVFPFKLYYYIIFFINIITALFYHYFLSVTCCGLTTRSSNKRRNTLSGSLTTVCLDLRLEA